MESSSGTNGSQRWAKELAVKESNVQDVTNTPTTEPIKSFTMTIVVNEDGSCSVNGATKSNIPSAFSAAKREAINKALGMGWNLGF